METEHSRNRIELKIKGVVSGALDIEMSEIQIHSSLIDDLGAESIDFLDIRYRLETEFGIKIKDDELWKGSLLDDHPGWLTSQGISKEGLERLKLLIPDFRWDRFPKGVKSEDLPRLITIRTIIEFIAKRLKIDITENP